MLEASMRLIRFWCLPHSTNAFGLFSSQIVKLAGALSPPFFLAEAGDGHRAAMIDELLLMAAASQTRHFTVSLSLSLPLSLSVRRVAATRAKQRHFAGAQSEY